MKSHSFKISLGLAASFLLSLAAISQTQAAPGDLDASFGAGGKVFTAVDAFPRRVRVQTDGKIVTLGSPAYPAYVSMLSRRNADGSVDTSFGTDGFLILRFEINPSLYDFAIQPDGKLIVIGGLGHVALLRFNPNGSPDMTFGTNGIVQTEITTSPAHLGAAGFKIALQGDGKIVATGAAYINYDDDYFPFLIRYRPDGTLDPAFGTSGMVIGPELNMGGNDVLIQPDGKLLDYGSGKMFRYNSNGTLDSSFGGNGRADIDASVVALQSDGKIVVNNYVSGWGGGVLKRYNDNGTPDLSFGTNGYVIIPRDTTPVEYFVGIAQALTIQRNGKIITAGQRNSAFAVARYNPNGTIDTAFGQNGFAITPFENNGRSSQILAISLQPDGKIVAAGNFLATNYYGVQTVRYMGDAVAPSVAISGKVMTPDGRGLRNAVVSIVDTQGVRMTTTTGSFGFYEFNNIAVDETYILSASSKRYRFATRSIQVNSSLTNVDLIGVE